MNYDAELILRGLPLSCFGNSFQAKGYIYNDKKERFDDGTSVTTSKIKFIDFEKGILKTRNTTYKIIENKEK